ncbi:AraC family transcriptional regulator [Sulfidibacter corallicola]|uniref:AraC family transcriptional regulator n=1 Tax=Sulfidibacter corallicola TaxID=2818388 RepID=A0A8A4TII3_SULCO|nr:helix-turn-helix domain-containing protein [Sulfidibacter corallicola]QTD48994.1 AraC family transcriptional regulator [Sulfidibacter corallicola]
MNYRQQIQSAIDYIEEHLHEELTTAQVASVAAISQWHFQRIFKALTKETLKTYIRCRRMSHTLDRLLGSDARIIDIAMDAGYETQESFTRAFKQMFGMTPNRYRKMGENALFLKKLKLEGDYMDHINQNLTLEPKIVRMEAKRYLGMRTSFYGPESEKNNIGDKLPVLWQNALERMEEIEHLVPGMGYGIVRQTRERTDLLEYFAAFEVTHLENPLEGFELVELPATTYALFTHRGYPRSLNHTVNYIYANWLLRSGRRHSYAADLEFYGSEYRPDSDKSVIHYAIPLVEEETDTSEATS